MRDAGRDDSTTPAARMVSAPRLAATGAPSPVGIDAPTEENPIKFATLADAARLLGYPTADALRRGFGRHLIPQRFLIRLGRRTVRVDVESLLVFLRQEATARELTGSRE
jgi:hypothetical protein